MTPTPTVARRTHTGRRLARGGTLCRSGPKCVPGTRKGKPVASRSRASTTPWRWKPAILVTSVARETMGAVSTQEPSISATYLLTELDLPMARTRAELMELQGAFAAALQPALDLLASMAPEARGEQGFAVPALLVRGINDLLVAFHLLSHGYINQAYNAMRMAYEAADLLELVGKDASEAHRWVNSQKPWSDFAPSNVRERLGNPRHDEIYSQLCAYSHPRFEGTRAMGYMTRRAGDTEQDWQHILRVGPFLIDDHPEIGFAAGLLGSTLGLVVLRTSYLVICGVQTEAAWDDAISRSMANQHRYMAAAAGLLKTRGVEGTERLSETYAQWRAILDEEDRLRPPDIA